MERCHVCHGVGFIPDERECANENCRKMFRFQDNPRTLGVGTPHARGVIYCSHRCAKATSERRRRARRKAALVEDA